MALDALVLCTRERPVELGRCLESVACQTRIPARIAIVDASDDRRSESVVRSFEDRLPVAYQRSTQGLTRQRNLGVRSLPDGVRIVHFVDDDVVLDPGYFAAIVAVFDADSGHEVGGVGGLIQNLPPHRPHLYRRLFLLDSTRGGAVLPSGVNVLVFSAEAPMDVDWLSGCAMSYRRELVERLGFDEKLVGYGLGEDVEFSYRVAKTHRLLVTPAARLEHLSSPVGRLAPRPHATAEVVSRYRRVLREPGRLRPLAFWWSVGGELTLLLAKSVLYSRRFPLLRAAGLVSGSWRAARHEWSLVAR